MISHEFPNLLVQRGYTSWGKTARVACVMQATILFLNPSEGYETPIKLTRMSFLLPLLTIPPQLLSWSGAEG